MTTHTTRFVGRRVGPRVFGFKTRPMTEDQRNKAEKRHALITQLIAEHPKLNALGFGAWPECYQKQLRALL
jgi:hypothetical protein